MAVGHEQQDALEVLQRLLQPHTGLQIQMVGGLQQQAASIRIAEGSAAGLQLSEQLRQRSRAATATIAKGGAADAVRQLWQVQQ